LSNGDERLEKQSLDFSLMGDERVRLLVEDYFAQATKAFKARSYLGAIVGYGAVVEGLLTWALLQKEKEALRSSRAAKDKEGNPKPLQEWDITKLIEVSVELNLIGPTASKASWALKDFRNFIHPFNVLKQSARPDRTLATNAGSALAEILRSLKGRLSQ
jgi:hypothetical protein